MARHIRIFALLLSAVAAGSPATAETLPDHAPNRVIIKFKPSAAPARAAALRGAAAASVERRFRGGAQVWRLGGMSVEDALSLFSADPNVEYVEPDYVISIGQADQRLPNDPRLDELWAMDNFGQTGGTPDADIDAPEAWTIRTDCDVLIGVIDTGADWHHEDLAANIWTNPGEIPGNFIDDDHNGFVDDVRGWDFFNDDNDPMDDNRHGTHVSGTIAAVGDNGIGISGVCWRAQLVPIKVLDENGRGTISLAIAGIEYATQIGCKLTNNSWGSDTYSRALDEALALHAQTGSLFIAAAGNTARDTDFFPHYPADHEYDNIVSVANTDHDDSLSATSSFGTQSVDLGAPGSSIRSVTPDDRYGILNGTSMAAPHVTGAVALIMSEAPLMTPAEVRAHLVASVDVIPAMAGKALSGGRLNVYRALSSLDATPPSPVSRLRVRERGSNTVTLEWTAPYDDAGDDTSGPASAYEIRYSDAPIKSHNFEDATPVVDPPKPGAPGTTETVRVGGLDIKSTYFFAVRALDERLNASEPSMAAAGHTKDAPEASLSPVAFEGAALSGAVSTHVLKIENTGKGTLDFLFPVSSGAWARAEPAVGTVRAREAVEVTVALDALGLGGGQYETDLVMTSNDPSRPESRMPVRLTVTSAPHLVVSDPAIGFGPLFVGAATSRELTVTNRGDQVLSVAAVDLLGPAGGATPDFDIDAAPFDLAPGMSRAVAVRFAPKAPSAAAATLRISSNDPDSPDTFVALTGLGLPPPDIAVAPDGIDLQLFTGETTNRVITIRNEGDTDLEWGLETHDAGDFGSGRRVGADVDGPYRDLTGVRILYDAAHRNLHWFNYNTMFVDLRSRGADIVVSNAPFTPDVLAPFDVVWIAESWDPLSDDEREALVQWVRAGGGLLLEADYEPTIPTFNALLDALFAGIVMSPDNGETGITNNIEPHETTRDVTNVFLSRVTATLGEVRPPAQTLIYDVEGVANTAWSRSGAGRVYMMADQNLANHRMGRTGNQILGNRIIDWLALGVSWLDVQPTAGTIAPGGEADLAVSVDAAGLGGAFGARIAIRSNDPDEPTVTLPVHLAAAPAPDIVVGVDALAFPPTAIERVSQETVTVGNVGASGLEVTGVSSTHGDFSASPSVFTVPPGRVVTMTVSYAPSVAGEVTGSLAIASNDPVDGVVEVPLSGEGFVGTAGEVSISGGTGPNLRSWNIDTADDAPAAVFAGVLDDVAQIAGYEGGVGLVFDPRVPASSNTLERLDHLRAYWIELLEPTTITINGFIVDPSTPIPLSEGWNTISYLPAEPDEITHALASIMDNLTWALGYHEQGEIYLPTIPDQFNTLKTLRPTFGYWVQLAAPDTLVYPDTVTAAARRIASSKLGGPRLAVQPPLTRPTREWIGVWGRDVEIDGARVPSGTVVTALDADGVVCGGCVVERPGEFGIMPVYRDDPATPGDEGVSAAGEPITITVGDRPFTGLRWQETGAVYELGAVAVMSNADGEHAPATPLQSALHANVPNPFNPVTTIAYDVATAARVRLVVYDVRGRRVRTLVDRSQPPGRYTVEWNGQNDAGRPVATGVYFYRLVAGDVDVSRKMVLLK